jgi:hypothetical protein
MKKFDFEKYKTWLLSDNPSNRDIAVNVFYHCGIIDEDVDKHLITLLKTDDSQEIRRIIIHLFCDRVDEKFSQAFFEALNDDDYVIRGNAYLGLVRLGVDKDHHILANYRSHAIHDFERYCISESITV